MQWIGDVGRTPFSVVLFVSSSAKQRRFTMHDQNSHTQTLHRTNGDSNGQYTNGQSSSRFVFHSVLNELSPESRRITLPAGTIIHEPERPADFAPIIHRGQVRLYQVGEEGASRLCEILGADEWFGVAALAGNATYGVRAIAVGPTVIT